MRLCDCAIAAINHGYIIRGGTYDENTHNFVETDNFWIPLKVRDERGRFRAINVTIKCCPICGAKLTLNEV